MKVVKAIIAIVFIVIYMVFNITVKWPVKLVLNIIQGIVNVLEGILSVIDKEMLKIGNSNQPS